jgi:hypothetical protein
MTSRALWTPLVRPIPPATTASRATTSGPDDTLLVVQISGTYLEHLCARWGFAVWRWTAGEWSLAATCLPPQAFQASLFAYFDPAAGDFFFGGAERERLVVASPRAPSDFRVLPLPKAERWGNAFAYFDPRRGTGMVHFGEETFAIHPDRAELIAKGPRLDVMAFDPQRGKLVGFDQGGRYVSLHGEAWEPMGDAPAHVRSSTMVVNPGTGRLACLVQDGEGLALLGEAEGGWKPLGRRLPAALRYSVLMSHGPSASLLVWGGYGGWLAGTDTEVNQTWVSSSGDFALRGSAWHLRLGSYTTPLVQNGRPLIVGYGAFDIHELGGEGWEPWPEAKGNAIKERDGRAMSFAASDEHLYLVDSEGGVFRRTREGPWQRMARPKPGPGGRTLRESAIAFDETTGRLTLFGDRERNDTWVLGTKGWSRLSGQPCPPRGIAAAVSTPEGLYVLVRSELWRLLAGRWTHVAAEEALGLGQWDARFLFYDRRRSLLGVVCGAGVFFFDGARWHRVAELALAPPETDTKPFSRPRHPFTSMFLLGYGGTVAFDPSGDRLLGLASGAFLQLPLSGLELPAPAPARKTPAQRTSKPPARWSRAAAQLRWARGAKAPARRPVRGPPGYELIATLPASRELDLEGHGGLAVFLWEEPFAVSAAKAVRIELFPKGRKVPALALDPKSEALRPVSFRPFTDVDPDHLDEVDTTPGEELAHSSKVGGYPRFIQGDEAGKRLRCGQCKARLRFAAQLSSDLFGGSRFGDVGRLYIYICPKGHQGRGILQSH